MIALDRNMCQSNQSFAPRRVREDLQGCNRFIGFFFSALLRPFQRTAGGHGFQNSIQQMATIALLDRPADHRRLIGGAMMHSMQQR